MSLFRSILPAGLVLWFATAARAQDETLMKRIAVLKQKGDAFYYVSFDTVDQTCREIIRLAGEGHLITTQLEALYTLGYCADYHQRIEEFKACVDQGKQLMQDHRSELDRIDPTGVHRASMIMAVGMYSFALGDFEEAIRVMTRIVPLDSAPLTTDSSTLSSVCAYLGQSWFNSGNIDQAVPYFALAVKYLPHSEIRYNYVRAVYDMYTVECLTSANQMDEALARLGESRLRLEREKNPASVRNSLISNYKLAALIYLRKGDCPTARQCIYKALAYHKTNDYNYTYTYGILGDIFYNAGESDSASLYYSKSLNLFNRDYAGLHAGRVQSLMGLGNIERDRNRFALALELYKECLSNLTSAGVRTRPIRPSEPDYSFLQPDKAMQVLLEEGRLFYRWYRKTGNPDLLDSCTAVLNGALRLNDFSRRELIRMESKELRARLQFEITDLAMEAAYLSCTLHDDVRSRQMLFAFMEKNKGNILLDQVSEERARKFAGIPESLLQEEIQIRGEIGLLQNRLLSAPDTSETAALTGQYNEKVRACLAWLSKIEQTYPRFFELKYALRAPRVEEISRRLMMGNAMMIEFYVSTESVYAAGIGASGMTLLKTERNDSLNGYMNALIRLMTQTDAVENANDRRVLNRFVQGSAYLYKKLLAPLLNRQQGRIRELIIIPDGPLCYLPFEALLTSPEPTDRAGFSSLPYLIRRFRIRYGYSASLVMEQGSTPSGSRYPYAGFAPSFEENPLHANREEIRSCSAILNGLSFEGEKASESAFRSVAGNAAILHLATHAVVNDFDPRKSFIAFSDGSDTTEDGLLHTYELYTLKLSACIAILSGCETGTGQMRKGEGILSLARAFNYAGCSNVVMSLWKVNDKITKDVMTRFCRLLKRGILPAEALRRAKLEYLEQSADANPVFWSSFVLIGNDPVTPWYLLHFSLITRIMLTLLLVVLSGWMVWRHHRKSNTQAP